MCYFVEWVKCQGKKWGKERTIVGDSGFRNVDSVVKILWFNIDFHIIWIKFLDSGLPEVIRLFSINLY